MKVPHHSVSMVRAELVLPWGLAGGTKKPPKLEKCPGHWVKQKGLLRGKVTKVQKVPNPVQWRCCGKQWSPEEIIWLKKWLKNEFGDLWEPKYLWVVSSAFRKWESSCSFLFSEDILQRMSQIHHLYFHPADALKQDTVWLFCLKSYNILLPYTCKIITLDIFSDGLPENKIVWRYLIWPESTSQLWEVKPCKIHEANFFTQYKLLSLKWATDETWGQKSTLVGKEFS